MKKNIPCPKCDGTGTFRDWLKNTEGKWYHQDVRCPRCLGLGKYPGRSKQSVSGYFAVHSVRASHLSVDEILDLLEIPYADPE